MMNLESITVFYIKEFTELHSVETFESNNVNGIRKIERKRDKIKKKFRRFNENFKNVSQNLKAYCNQKSFKNGVKISLIFSTGFGLMFLGPQLPAMARDNFLSQGKEGMYPLPLPEKSRLAYMKTWVSPYAWRSFLSTGQLSPEFKGFLSTASTTVVPFVAGGAMGILFGGGVSYLVTNAAIKAYGIKHNAVVHFAANELAARNHSLKVCTVNVVNLSNYLDTHGYLNPPYLAASSIEANMKEMFLKQPDFIKTYTWEFFK